MQLRNISNGMEKSNKIVHQINNEGCKCPLCQKVVINEMKVVKKTNVEDVQSQLTKGQRQCFFSKFLQEFYYVDKMARKIKLIIPQMCIFDRGCPVSLITKKRQTLPMKILKNKEKLNAFEIQNFFIQGFIFHNNFKENTAIGKIQAKYKFLKKERHNYDEALKNQCIVLVKYNNGSTQMITPSQLNNLFKSKQRAIRNEISNITTMVCSNNYNEIRIPINLDSLQNQQFFERAKNQVKMINQDIKPKDFLFRPERQQRAYEDKLRDQSHKNYLEYLSLKLLLLYSLRTDVLFKNCLFKYVKDQGQAFYLVDIQVYEKVDANKLWGYFAQRSKVKLEPLRQRPASSPERLQKKKKSKQSLSPQCQNNGTICIPRDSSLKRQLSLVGRRVKTISTGLFKLQPITMKK